MIVKPSVLVTVVGDSMLCDLPDLMAVLAFVSGAELTDGPAVRGAADQATPALVEQHPWLAKHVRARVPAPPQTIKEATLSGFTHVAPQRETWFKGIAAGLDLAYGPTVEIVPIGQPHPIG